MISGNPERVPRAKCRASLPSSPSSLRPPPRDRVEEKRKGREFVFLPSNLFGLLSLASRVFDNNGPAGIRVPIPMPGRAPVEIVTAPRAATRGRFRLPSSRAPGSVKFIYLINRPAVRWILFLLIRRKKQEGEREKERENSNRNCASPLSFRTHVTYPRIRISGPTTVFRMTLCFAFCSPIARLLLIENAATRSLREFKAGFFRRFE